MSALSPKASLNAAIVADRLVFCRSVKISPEALHRSSTGFGSRRKEPRILAVCVLNPRSRSSKSRCRVGGGTRGRGGRGPQRSGAEWGPASVRGRKQQRGVL